MTGAATLIKLVAFATEAVPELIVPIRKLVCAFWSCNRVDLGPMPPDLKEWHAIDDAIDAVIEKRGLRK